MNKITAILVEDEYKVRAVFSALLEKFCPEIEVLAEADNITDAFKLISELNPQVVFLDIEMPSGNGFELLAKFKQPTFETIFVTSYGHYAIKAIKFSALDYLLKPVMIQDLLLITEKIKERMDERHQIEQYQILQSNLQSPQLHKLVLNTKTNLVHIDVADIVYLQADGNYTSIYLKNKTKHYVARTLKEYEDLLCGTDAESFIRIHKTYIVNPACIIKVEKGDSASVLLQGDIRLEISRRKKHELMEKLNK
jgi:two-component system LytT family response regulator